MRYLKKDNNSCIIFCLYLVPISEIAGKTAFRWRYEYPPTGQKQGIHLASDYELKNQISKLRGEVIE